MNNTTDSNAATVQPDSYLTLHYCLSDNTGNTLVKLDTPDGNEFAEFLRELTPTTALFDFNHPLADKPIHFEVEIIGIM